MRFAEGYGELSTIMSNKSILFVAFQEQDNLGIGYLSSVLLEAGYRPIIVDFLCGEDILLQKIKDTKPLIVGFSLIFQYHIRDFQRLIRHLRVQGVGCHFCAGGHFPSLRSRELFELIPELDSVVLYEGEKTFRELAEKIDTGESWRKIRGIAYNDNGAYRINPLRPLEENLDSYPIPVRPPLKEFVLKKKFATLLASRGCYYDCSFCSIREFYSKPPGPVKRMRSPEHVAREMSLLHDELDCSVFMFQDDDFPVGRKPGVEWTLKLCELLDENDLSRDIMWKINCRPDEVDEQAFARMKTSGLFLVYLGIESGTDEGLSLMNKHMPPETNFRAIATLKHLHIEYDFGFMLFDPSTSFKSIFDNLDFLEKLCGDGSAPITFCKMLPYAETKIEKYLAEQGRLKGEAGFEDYAFLDPAIDQLHNFIVVCFSDWIGKRDGLLNMIKWIKYYLSISKKYYLSEREYLNLKREAETIIKESNLFLLDTLREITSVFFDGFGDKHPRLEKTRAVVKDVHPIFQSRVKQAIQRIERAV